MPAEIFATEFRVVDCHVIALPERVLGRDFRVAQFEVLHILEYIFAVADESIDVKVIAEHERIGPAV